MLKLNGILQLHLCQPNSTTVPLCLNKRAKQTQPDFSIYLLLSMPASPTSAPVMLGLYKEKRQKKLTVGVNFSAANITQYNSLTDLTVYKHDFVTACGENTRN